MTITFDEKLEAAWGLHKIEKAVFEKEIAELKAENDKLKKELDFAIKGVEKYEAIIDVEKELSKDDLSKKLREANGYLFRDWKENARLMWQAAEEIEKLREALSNAAGELRHAYIMGFTERYRDAAIAASSAAASIRESGDE